MSVAGRNITSFAENAKGAASRASVPPLSNARTIYRKGEQDNDRLSEQASRVEWCACFVSWCADQSGHIQSVVIPKFSLCSDGVKWFESKGRFRDASYTPAAGDIIFFDWGNNGTIDHVGIVESVSGGTVNTIEGNSGDKVARRSYCIGSSNIYGYGVPAY